MDPYELKIIKSLAMGMSQSDISNEFKKKGISPNSVSSIEKYLRSLKEQYGAKTLFHLAVILKNKGEL